MFCYSPLRKHGYVIKISILKPTGGEGGNLGHQIILQYQKPCKYVFHGKHSNNMNANSWILSFRFRKSFFVNRFCPPATETLHPNPSWSPQTPEKERWRERARERLERIKLIGHILQLFFTIVIHPAFWYRLKQCRFKVTFQHYASFWSFHYYKTDFDACNTAMAGISLWL